MVASGRTIGGAFAFGLMDDAARCALSDAPPSRAISKQPGSCRIKRRPVWSLGLGQPKQLTGLTPVDTRRTSMSAHDHNYAIAHTSRTRPLHAPLPHDDLRRAGDDDGRFGFGVPPAGATPATCG